jgi:PAS domain S-box-containing protein
LEEETRSSENNQEEIDKLRLRVNELEEVEARRARVDRAIEQSEKYFRSMAENSLDIIKILDKDSVLIYYSPSAKRVLGYENDEVLGLNVLAFIHPDDVAGVADALTSVVQDPGSEATVEHRFRHKDGSWRYLESTGKGIFEGSELSGIIVNSRDITGRKLMEEDLKKHHEHLEELVAERTRELEAKNEQLEKEIAQRIQAEEALRESEEKFRLISEQSMMGVMIIQDDKIKYVNQAAADIYGYTIGEALGWGPGDYINAVHPDDREFVREQVRKKQGGAEDQVVNYSYRIVTRAGRFRWVEVYSKTVDYGGRKADLVTTTDITDRVFMEEELKNSEEHFRSLIENALDVISVINEEAVITFMSPSVEGLLGYTPGEITGRVGLDFVHPDDVPKVAEGLRFVMENPGETATLELRAIHEDGSWRDLEVKGRNFLDHPSVQGIVVNFRDVAERKMIRERLERINHLFLSLGADLIGNMEKIVGAGRDILSVAFAAYSRMEKGKFSILSTAPGEEGLLITDQPDTYMSCEIISQDREDPWIIENLGSSPYRDIDPLVKKYGFRSFLGYPVRGQQQTIGCLCLFDAERRKFSHDEVEIAGMLARALSVEEERLSREQGLKDFIDVASHELRHPITLMKGYALTLRDFGERLGDNAKREYLTIIGEGADRLDMLIKELLDVSRIERGRFSLNRQEVRLEPLIERSVREMRGKGCAGRLSISVPGTLAPRRLDPEKLVRVLVILLDNAVNHSPESSRIEMVAEERDGAALISVMDRGAGVPEKDRERIFERFYQVEDALHHSAPGMGLGLYIAREIVEVHGGKIWYEPRDGGGSVFRFTIP